jgi:hypothetical protein
MPQRFRPGDLITADIINNILMRLENLEARLAALEDRKNNAKETKEKEKEKEKDKDSTKETKDKEKDTKETKEKDTKETKDKEKEKEKDTKETKDTKDTKEKDTKETKDTKDTKEKDTKDTKEKDTKEKEKDTKEQSKDTKESKEAKENKENKEEKEEKEQKDTGKEFLSLKEKENIRDQIPAPYTPNAPPAHFGLDAAQEEEREPDGRAFILPEERPQVGRAAFDLADKQDDKLPEAGTSGKQAEAFN